MKYILPAAMMLFSIAVLATSMKNKTEIVQAEQDVRSTFIVGKKR